jgi:hypothetical protein
MFIFKKNEPKIRQNNDKDDIENIGHGLV